MNKEAVMYRSTSRTSPVPGLMLDWTLFPALIEELSPCKFSSVDSLFSRRSSTLAGYTERTRNGEFRDYASKSTRQEMARNTSFVLAYTNIYIYINIFFCRHFPALSFFALKAIDKTPKQPLIIAQ